MSNKQRGQIIRQKILDELSDHPRDIVALISQSFAISPQAVHNHIRRLEEDGWISASGKGKGKRYFPGKKRFKKNLFEISESIAEDRAWADHFQGLFEQVKENVVDICHYGFTEIVNNAIDHSNGQEIYCEVEVTANKVWMLVIDDGEGIFRRIRRINQLADEREALFDLAKGKLTTNPERHTGEGIFFTSRVFDYFAIKSKGLRFSHQEESDLGSFNETKMEADKTGTSVLMVISRNSDRSLVEIFDRYSSGPEEYKFNKTRVPIALGMYGNENLVSRSQAKRVLTRIDQFERVVFDFAGVAKIGQAFADEIFRVFAIQHPGVSLEAVNMEEEVTRMVNRAIAKKNEYLSNE